VKLSEPAGRVERLGFYKGGPGFTVIIPTALLRYRKELGLNRNSLSVLVSIMSHGRPSAPDYCEAAYSAIVEDTGLHKSVVCACLRILLAPFGSEVVVSKRRSPKDEGKTKREKVTVRGLGLLERAAVTSGGSKRRRAKFTWRDGAPKRDTNVYHLGPLADRLQVVLRPPEPPANTANRTRWAKPRYDIEDEPERHEEETVEPEPDAEPAPSASRWGKPRYEADPEEDCKRSTERDWDVDWNHEEKSEEQPEEAVRFHADGRIAAITFKKHWRNS
jgi:hypothetical protein